MLETSLKTCLEKLEKLISPNALDSQNNAMHSQKLNGFIRLIDLKPVGLESLYAAYVLKGSRVGIIDPGPTVSVENLLSSLGKTGIKRDEIHFVLVTHVHIDHAGGAGVLLDHLPNAKLLVHKKGAPHLINPEKLWRQSKKVLGNLADLYQEIKPVPEERIIRATDGMVIDLGEGVELKVLETPGHASHHLSFYEKGERGIFSGDAAGIYLKRFNVVLPTSPPPFRLQMALASLDRLIKMAPKKILYTHFGPSDEAVKRLKLYEFQLKFWEEIISEEVTKGEGLQTIYRTILEKDPSAKIAADYIKGHSLLESAMIRNLQGFLEIFKKNSSAERKEFSVN